MTLAARLRERSAKRVAIFVSRYDHCLYDLLLRHRAGELACEIPLIVSNHPDLQPRRRAVRRALPGLPDHAATQARAGAARARAARGRAHRPGRARALHAGALARVRRRATRAASSTSTTRSCRRSCGGKPYHQAHERGVKLIGATAHYATSDLDEGPIIEQDVIARLAPRLARRPGAQGPRPRAAACWRARCAGTSRTACSSTATRPSSSSECACRLIGLFVGLGVAIACWVLTFAAWRFDEVAQGVAAARAARFPAAHADHARHRRRLRESRAPRPGHGDRARPIACVLVDAGRGVAESLRAATAAGRAARHAAAHEPAAGEHRRPRRPAADGLARRAANSRCA